MANILFITKFIDSSPNFQWMITKTLIKKFIYKSPNSIKKSPTILLILSPNSMVFSPKCHTKSPKYILFSYHQIALLNNQNHLFNHQKFYWKTDNTVLEEPTVPLKVGQVSLFYFRFAIFGLRWINLFFKFDNKTITFSPVLSVQVKKSVLRFLNMYIQLKQDTLMSKETFC